MYSLISNLICTGGCINASPAGKRRIANGADQQQLSSVADDALMGNGKESTGLLSHFGSAFTAITSIAVAACLLIITIFVIIFAILQVSRYFWLYIRATINHFPVEEWKFQH